MRTGPWKTIVLLALLKLLTMVYSYRSVLIEQRKLYQIDDYTFGLNSGDVIRGNICSSNTAYLCES